MRPLLLIACAVLISLSITYYSAMACQKAENQVAAAESTLIEASEAAVASDTDRAASSSDTLVASLKAGVAVGKALYRTASTILSTVVHAAFTTLASVASEHIT